MKRIIILLILIYGRVNAQSIDSTIFQAAPSFSGQIAILKGDSIFYSASHGWMNYPMQQKMKNDAMMELGELSSRFTREAFLELIDKKMVNEDSLVCKYISNFPYTNIKIKHLLNSNSGLPSNYIKLYHRNIFNDENIKLKDKLVISNKSIIDLLIKFKPTVEYLPEERVSDCNTNDIVLAYLLEIFYFKSYDEIINEMIKKKYPKLNIVACSDWRNTPLMNRASGQAKLDSTHYSIQESLHDMGFKYDDATLGHHHIYADAKSIVKYFGLCEAEQKKRPFELVGFEPGFNSFVSYNGQYTIAILSNISNENDTKLLVEEIKKRTK